MNKNDGAYEQRLAKLKKDGNGVVRTTSRIEDANRDDTNEAIPKWTKKSGLKRGEGWAEEGLDRFQILLDMVHEDRNVEENKVVEDQLLKFWSEIEKGKKRKRKRRVRVVTVTKKRERRNYDGDTDDETNVETTNTARV